jgi:anthranilate/para-aminobenzoate synthase component II
MGVQHVQRPWFGMQFHPESILTPDGDAMLADFVRRVRGECRPAC